MFLFTGMIELLEPEKGWVKQFDVKQEFEEKFLLVNSISEISLQEMLEANLSELSNAYIRVTILEVNDLEELCYQECFLIKNHSLRSLPCDY